MSERISPTAHYTGYVWVAHGFSHDAFATPTGRAMYRALRPVNAAAHAMGLPTLEGMLVARHHAIDACLDRAIEAGQIGQIIEVACGLSPRGWRLRQRYGDALDYVEADLPGMIARKRDVLARLGTSPHHRTAEIDALADSGPTSIEALCATLDPARGTAIVTEGLVNYFDRATVTAMWARFARALARFPHGMYVSDLVTRDISRGALVAAFRRLLGAFVRGSLHIDFADGDDAARALEAAGFTRAAAHDPRELVDLPDSLGAGVVRVLEATR
ncbi:MAG TPA: class I SAM-dependent methyltransferase [Kofleriaceae bacterium]|nr:class I SAM-dependent methyltransferase [Kofleriaceae bacterium]